MSEQQTELIDPEPFPRPTFDDSETRELMAKVKALPPISNEAQAEQVAFYSKGFYAIEDEIHRVYDHLAQMAHRMHLAITGDRKKELDKTQAGLRITNGLIAAWADKKEAERKAEEDRLRRMAEEEAEAQRLARAQEALEAFDDDTAQEIMDEPPEPPLFVPPPKAPAKIAQGLSTAQGRYYAHLVDEMDVFKAIAEGKIPKAYAKVDMTFANKQAQALKKEFNVPGFELMQGGRVIRRNRREG